MEAAAYVLTMPPEILAEIFSHTAPLVDRGNVRETPWALAQVCSVWRDNALALGSLWSDIGMCCPHTKHTLPRVEELLKRAGNRSLKFSFRSFTTLRPVKTAVLLALLVAVAERWQDANLFIKPRDFALLAGVSGRLGRLRYLLIQVVDHDPMYISPETSNPFAVAPALREVRFERVERIHHALVMPFGQLTSLRAVWSLQFHRDVLPFAPNLEDATLWVTGPAVDSASGQRVCLPRLTGLFISRLDVLNILELPSLESLVVDDPRDADPFLSFLSRSRAPTLNMLGFVDSSSATLPAFMTMVRASPGITSLSITIKTDPSLLCALVLRRTPYILPKLETLLVELAWCPNHRRLHGQPELLTLVESRWNLPQGISSPCVRLRTLDLGERAPGTKEGETGLDYSSVVLLASLDKQGLQVLYM